MILFHAVANSMHFFAEHLTSIIQELTEILHLQLLKQGQILPNKISMVSQHCIFVLQVK
jgi:hypothetical protein